MARRDMLIPKPAGKRRTNFLPVLPDTSLRMLMGRLGPPERKAMREICDGGDVLLISGEAWLLAPVSRATLGALAAFEADAEDRELEQDNEPNPDMEDNGDRELDLSDFEPDHRVARFANPQIERQRTVLVGYLSRHE